MNQDNLITLFLQFKASNTQLGIAVMASFAAPQFQQSTSQNQAKEGSTNGNGTQIVGEKRSSTSIQRIEEEPAIEQTNGQTNRQSK